MNKISLLPLLIVLLGQLSPGQELKLNCPSGMERWPQGDQRTITWTSSGCSGTVRLMLYTANGVKVGNIATGLPVSGGSYDWSVGQYIGGVAPVASYQMHIRLEGTQTADESSTSFVIDTPQSCRITCPRAGATWSAGETHAVMWEQKSSRPMKFLGQTVKISLIYAYSDGEVQVITASTPRDGSYSWTLPSTIPLQYYRVRVTSNGSEPRVLATSEIITIQPKINVSSPAADANWKKNGTYAIHWAIQGPAESNISIWLMDILLKERIYIITSGVAATGTYLWHIPSVPSFATGRFRVQVRTNHPGNTLFGTGSSHAFNIVPE